MKPGRVIAWHQQFLQVTLQPLLSSAAGCWSPPAAFSFKARPESRKYSHPNRCINSLLGHQSMNRGPIGSLHTVPPVLSTVALALYLATLFLSIEVGFSAISSKPFLHCGSCSLPNPILALPSQCLPSNSWFTGRKDPIYLLSFGWWLPAQGGLPGDRLGVCHSLQCF